GHAGLGVPVATDPARPYVTAAVIYYGTGEVKAFRLDQPILFVRAGLDQPVLMKRMDALLARAFAANAPVEVINHAGGQHPFEMDSSVVSRDIIAGTLEIMKRAIRPDYVAAL